MTISKSRNRQSFGLLLFLLIFSMLWPSVLSIDTNRYLRETLSLSSSFQEKDASMSDASDGFRKLQESSSEDESEEESDEELQEEEEEPQQEQLQQQQQPLLELPSVNEELEFTLNFPGYRNNPQDGISTLYARPNPTVAAGTSYIVSVSQAHIEIRIKNGALATEGSSLTAFVSPINQMLREFASTDEFIFMGALYHPKIIWDAFSDRFVVVVLREVSVGSTLRGSRKAYLLYGAISKGPNPLTLDESSWKYFAMDVSDLAGPDSTVVLRPWLPDHAADRENLYVVCAMNNQVNSSFVESRLWVLNKEALYGEHEEVINMTSMAEVVAIDGSIYGLPPQLEASPAVPSKRQVELSTNVLKSATALRVEGQEEPLGPYVLGYRSGFGSLPANRTDFGVYCVSYQSEPVATTNTANGTDTSSTSSSQFSHLILVSNVTNGNTDPLLTSRIVRLGDVEDFSRVLPDAIQPGEEAGFFRIDTGKRRSMSAFWHEGFLWFVTPVRFEWRTAIYWAKIRAPTGVESLAAIPGGGDSDDNSVSGSDSDSSSDSSGSDSSDSDSSDSDSGSDSNSDSGSGSDDDSGFVSKSGYVTGLDITDGAYVYNPSISINACDRVGIGFSLSSETVFPGSYMTFLNDRWDDGFEVSVPVAEGERHYDTSSGDGGWSIYSGSAVDFEIPSCLWFYNQYSPGLVDASNERKAGTWATHYKVECSCADNFGFRPTEPPTEEPSSEPTNEPTDEPTYYPTWFPTDELTTPSNILARTSSPFSTTAGPTTESTTESTVEPTTAEPTNEPTRTTPPIAEDSGQIRRPTLTPTLSPVASSLELQSCETMEEVLCQTHPELSTFCGALSKAQLSTTMFEEYMITLFAPTNAAFRGYWDYTGDSVESMSVDVLRNIVLSHATNDGAFTTEELTCGKQVGTFLGQTTTTKCYLTYDDVMLGNQNGSKAQMGMLQPPERKPKIENEIRVCNGFVQVVSNVIVPE